MVLHATKTALDQTIGQSVAPELGDKSPLPPAPPPPHYSSPQLFVPLENGGGGEGGGGEGGGGEGGGGSSPPIREQLTAHRFDLNQAASRAG